MEVKVRAMVLLTATVLTGSLASLGGNRDGQTQALADKDALALVSQAIAGEAAGFPQRPGETPSSVALIAKTTRFVSTAVIDEDAAQFGDYLLRVTRSSDRHHFQVALTPIHGCGKAWFATDSSAVYAGGRVDCGKS